MDTRHVIQVLRAHTNISVPEDVSVYPAFWRHQIPGLLMADVVAALLLDRSPASVVALRELLPKAPTLLRPPSPRPQMTTRATPIPKIHLTVHHNPHPPETSLHANWRRYREGMPVDVYRRIGGSPHILEGDIRRGFVSVA